MRSPSPRPHPLTASAALAALAVLALVAGACSSDDAASDDTERTAEEIVTDAAAAMTEVETAAFTLSQTGAEVPIDESGQLRFLAAEGRIARPASADAVVTVDALGFTTEIGAIAIDGVVWFTNPLTGEWAEAPAAFTFDPATLLDPDDGLPGLLAEAAATAELVDPADGPGEDDGPVGDGPWDRVRVTVDADRVRVLTGGLLSDPTTVDLWVDRSTDRVAELRFVVATGDGDSDWRMAITDYDIEVDIAPPEPADGG